MSRVPEPMAGIRESADVDDTVDVEETCSDATILELDALARRVAALRAAGHRVALCHGVFDLLHVGHLRYLRGASRLADVLVVTLTPDRFVDKGPHRPAFGEELRAEALAALEMVDHVAINRWPTAEETLRSLRPDVYVKGAEFQRRGADPTGKMERERAVAEDVGCRVEFIDDITFSSTALLNRHLPLYAPEVAEYLERLRAAGGLERALALLERMASLRVLVVGDAIVDEYAYVETLGKSSKDPTLAVRHLADERFAGGAVAVAHHVAALGCRVELLATVGEDEAGAFLAESLGPGVRGRWVERPGMPTVTKRRIVDRYSSNKLLSLYRMDVAPPPSPVVERQLAELDNALGASATPAVDLVVCADYGHQAIPTELVRRLCDAPVVLAVNTQANAGNRGFHTVTRYSRADFVCLAEHEIRLETRDSDGALRPMMRGVASALDAPLMVVTRGKRGSLALARDQDEPAGTFHEAPALASTVVDRVGAGDAYFAVASLAARLGAAPDLVSLLGNAAGAQAVGVVGNRRALDADGLRKQLTSLLK
ncbi:MAG: PfkB family carbohydrate kinase [Acidobacteriota bacterium]